LEAQNAGVPTVASMEASIPEIVKIPLLPKGEGARRADEGVLQDAPLPNPLPEGEGARDFSALLVNPKNPSAIAEAAYKLISGEELKNDIIKRGYENISRFSWGKCSLEISELLKD